MNRKPLVAVATLAVVVAAAYVWWWVETTSSTTDMLSTPASSGSVTTDTSSERDQPESPFSITTGTKAPVQPSAEPVTDTEPQPTISGSDSSSPAIAIAPPNTSVYELGRVDISDEDFLQWVAAMEADPELLQAVIGEFRSATDPARLRQLALLLGDVDDPQLVGVGSELLYSGNKASEEAALHLLRRIQPRNSAARDLVIDALGVVSEPELLIGALNAVSTPGDATPGQRAALVEQASTLTANESAVVRGHGYTVLSRWSDSPEVGEQVAQGLSDDDVSVRRAAAFAIAEGASPVSDTTVVSLWGLADNDQEDEMVRRGAVLALSNLPTMTDEDKDRLQLIRTSLR